MRHPQPLSVPLSRRFNPLRDQTPTTESLVKPILLFTCRAVFAQIALLSPTQIQASTRSAACTTSAARRSSTKTPRSPQNGALPQLQPPIRGLPLHSHRSPFQILIPTRSVGLPNLFHKHTPIHSHPHGPQNSRDCTPEASAIVSSPSTLQQHAV